MKKFMWITTCISSGCVRQQGLQICLPARRGRPGDQYGMMTTDFIAQ